MKDFPINEVWAVRDGGREIIEEIYDRVAELDPSDDYHEGEKIDYESYYRAIDRALAVINKVHLDWRGR